MRNYYVDGKWNAICDRCGFKYKNTDLKKEWTGLMVCKKCWEPRHPQTLIHIPQEQINTPWARPDPDNTYYTVNWTAVANGLAAVDALLNVTVPQTAPRKLGDLNYDGSVTSADSLCANRYAAGGAGNSQAINAYCKWFEQYLIADPTKYSAYLTLNTYSS